MLLVHSTLGFITINSIVVIFVFIAESQCWSIVDVHVNKIVSEICRKLIDSNYNSNLLLQEHSPVSFAQVSHAQYKNIFPANQ